MKTIRIRLHFRPDYENPQRGTICYRVSVGISHRQIASSHHIDAEIWDESAQDLIASGRSKELDALRAKIDFDIDRIHRIGRRLNIRSSRFNAADVAEAFKVFMSKCTFAKIMTEMSEELFRAGKFRSSEIYLQARDKFLRYIKNPDIMLDALNASHFDRFQDWMRRNGLTANTSSFYLRALRAAYNKAVDRGLIDDFRPFRRVWTGVAKTAKRALPLAAISRIKHLDLSAHGNLDYARDIFLLSFYLRGMSFVDMAFMQKSDLKNGELTYRRHKTGQRLTIGWTPEMQAIVDKYGPGPEPYLFPILRGKTIYDHRLYRNVNATVNRNLKQVAELAGIKVPLTMYVARHSWASAAKLKGVPIALISEGMGHENEKTTRIYLAALDTAAINSANAMIISSI